MLPPIDTKGRGWLIVMQPNKLFARYSESAKALTHLSMNVEAAKTTCRRYDLGWSEAEEEVARAANDPQLWKIVMATIKGTGYDGSAVQAEKLIQLHEKRKR